MIKGLVLKVHLRFTKFCTYQCIVQVQTYAHRRKQGFLLPRPLTGILSLAVATLNESFSTIHLPSIPFLASEVSPKRGSSKNPPMTCTTSTPPRSLKKGQSGPLFVFYIKRGVYLVYLVIETWYSQYLPLKQMLCCQPMPPCHVPLLSASRKAPALQSAKHCKTVSAGLTHPNPPPETSWSASPALKLPRNCSPQLTFPAKCSAHHSNHCHNIGRPYSALVRTIQILKPLA